MLLIIVVVGRDVGRIHVEVYGLFETAGRILPDEGGVVIGFQQFQQIVADRLADVAFAEVFGQQPEDARQHPALGSAHIHARHPSGEPRSGEPGSQAPAEAVSQAYTAVALANST